MIFWAPMVLGTPSPVTLPPYVPAAFLTGHRLRLTLLRDLDISNMPGFPLQLRLHLHQWPLLTFLQGDSNPATQHQPSDTLHDSLMLLKRVPCARLLHIAKYGCQLELQPLPSVDHSFCVWPWGSISQKSSPQGCSSLINHKWFFSPR